MRALLSISFSKAIVVGGISKQVGIGPALPYRRISKKFAHGLSVGITNCVDVHLTAVARHLCRDQRVLSIISTVTTIFREVRLLG